jgi:hypothetical protein
MTSTRNKNTCGDYRLQQDQYNLARIYTSYSHSQYGSAYRPAIPCVGITPGHMPRDTLSNNPVEIESALFGINSANLVTPQPAIVPQLKKIPEQAFFDRLPVILPEPLVIEDDQRPFPVPE